MGVKKGSKFSSKVSSNSKYLFYTKVLAIAILGLILLSLVYVLFLGKGKVVGKATGIPECYPIITYDNTHIDTINVPSCTAGEATKTYDCNSDGLVVNANDYFDALCFTNSAEKGTDGKSINSWVECNADGSPDEKLGDGIVAGAGILKRSDVTYSHYLCAKSVADNGKDQQDYHGFETWFVCPDSSYSSFSKSLGGSYNKLDDRAGDKKEYLCTANGWVNQPIGQETNCFDGNDDDFDGKTDCADEDCAKNVDGAKMCAYLQTKTCDQSNLNMIKSVDGAFDALCVNNNNKFQWYECDAEASSSGEFVHPSSSSIKTNGVALSGKNYLCAKNVDPNGNDQNGFKGYESWFICGANKLSGSAGVKKNTGNIVEGYKCNDDGWTPLADCSTGINCAKDECQKYIAYDSSKKVDTLCTNAKSNVCGDYANPFGTVINTGGFDALCYQNGDYKSWAECDADGSVEKTSSTGVTSTKGTVVSVGSTDYLCTLYKNEKGDTYESWMGCKSKKGPNGATAKEGDKLEGKVCVNNGKWMSDTCTEQGKLKTEGSKNYVCDGSWKSCESKGDLAVSGKFLCYGQSWSECSAKIKNQYTQDGSFLCDGSAWSAAIGSATVSAPEGFYWEQAPEQSKDIETESCLPVKSGLISSSSILKIPPVCCSSANYCGGLGYTLDSLSTGFGYCYAKNSVYNLPSTPLSFFCDVKDSISTWTYCDKDTAEKIKNDGKFACAQNEKKDYVWMPCTNVGLAAANTLYCNGAKWEECTKDTTDLVTSDNQYVCLDNKWGTTFNIGDNGIFEAKLIKGAKETKSINTYKSINLCDTDSNFFISKATLCYTKNNVVNKIQVSSDSYLYGGAKKPYDDGNILFLYQQEVAAKEVDMLLLKNVDNDVNISLSAFTTNLINGRRLGLFVNKEYYVLSHPKAESFDFSQMVLTHLPDHKVYTPIKSPSNVYQFKLSDTKVISVNIPSASSDKVMFSSNLVYEAPTVSAESQSLITAYELSFSLDKPITLSDVSGTVLTVCSKDVAVDPFNMLVCENGNYKETLQRDVLYSTTIAGQPVAFLYQYIDNKKVGRIFLRQVVENQDSDLDYVNFANNLAAGKRLAITFQGAHYLLEQPVGILLMPTMLLSSYTESGKVSYAASGSEKQVEFLIPEGKVVLKRDPYYLPPPPFKISGIDLDTIKNVPVNLKDQFFVSMSSQVPVMINTPDLKLVESADTLKGNANKFRIKFNSASYDLLFQKPFVKTVGTDSALFYYDNAIVDASNNYVKTAKIYYHYNLDNPNQNHYFNDTFIDIFTSGKEFSLQFAKSYYLIGYKGATAGKKSFFDLNNIALHFLNGTALYPEEVDLDKQQASFMVPGGKIYVTIDDTAIQPQLKFSAQTVKQLVPIDTFEEGKEINDVKILTLSNKVEIDNVKYTICDTPGTATNEQLVVLCADDQQLKPQINLNQYSKVGSYLFWYKGMINGQKEIEISKVQDLAGVNQLSLDWATIRDSVKAHQMATLFWQQQYFELSGTDQLSSWTLNKVPTGEVYVLDALTSTTEGLQGGIFSYEKNLLLANQTWDADFNVQFMLKPLDYYLLTQDGFNVSVGGKHDFVTALSSPLYNIPVYTLEVKHDSLFNNLVKVVLSEKYSSKILFLTWMPDKTMKHVLLPSGDVVTLETMKVKVGQNEQIVVHITQ